MRSKHNMEEKRRKKEKRRERATFRVLGEEKRKIKS